MAVLFSGDNTLLQSVLGSLSSNQPQGAPQQGTSPWPGVLEKLLPLLSVAVPAFGAVATTPRLAGAGAAAGRGAMAGFEGLLSTIPKPPSAQDKYMDALTQSRLQAIEQTKAAMADEDAYLKDKTPEQRAMFRKDPKLAMQLDVAQRSRPAAIEYLVGTGKMSREQAQNLPPESLDAAIKESVKSAFPKAVSPELAMKYRADMAVAGARIAELNAKMPKDRAEAEVALMKSNALKKYVSGAELTGPEQGLVASELKTPGGAAVHMGDEKITDIPTLEKEDPKVAATVKGLINYNIPLPQGFALKDPEWRRMLNLAAQIDPTFDASLYQERMRLKNDFATGKNQQNITAINTAIAHLNSLSKAAEELKPSSWRTYNTLANIYRQETGDPRVTNFITKRNAVAAELVKVFRGTSGSVEDVRGWQNTIDASSSPEQLKAAIDGSIDLIHGRLDALQDTWTRGMKKPLDMSQLLSPKSQEILKSLGDESVVVGPATAEEIQQLKAMGHSDEELHKAGLIH